MRSRTARRIAQTFFFLLFAWFCVVATVGEAWWQLRGWPINWFLQLDPLVAISTILTTHSLHEGLVWALVTIAATILLGRFFCGWVCPFGAIHQFFGWLGKMGRRSKARIQINQPHPAQNLKYWILLLFLTAAAGNLIANWIRTSREWSLGVAVLLGVALIGLLTSASRKVGGSSRRGALLAVLLLIAWVGIGSVLTPTTATVASLQTGLLDPIPLVYRSVNLMLLPALDGSTETLSPIPRMYQGAGSIGVLFVALVLLNLWVPRFFCRFLCPLGALLGLLSRFAVWRVGKQADPCKGCNLCERDCEGACSPSGEIRIAECVLCMNCVETCAGDGNMRYATQGSAGGEAPAPDLGRREAIAAVGAGLLLVPAMRLGGSVGANWNPALIRPPGTVREDEFLARCIKCGQCIRVCPTNVLQPANLPDGAEALWTPVLNNRIGTSGCQLNCIACGQACPTGAIRPFTLDEKLGRGAFADAGPIRMGTAFLDRGRCLPWAMDRPCIVCEENCPVTPKAIRAIEEFATLHNGQYAVEAVNGNLVTLRGTPLKTGIVATGDYSLAWGRDLSERAPLVANTADSVTLGGAKAPPVEPGMDVAIQIRLQKPVVDPALCIGCGTCEHECPISGRRAIRVTADNESRSRDHSFLLRGT